MFKAWCHTANRQVLIWSSSLRGIENTEAGMVLYYRCACGEDGVLITGKEGGGDVAGHLESVLASSSERSESN